jgi:hypothetical protein
MLILQNWTPEHDSWNNNEYLNSQFWILNHQHLDWLGTSSFSKFFMNDEPPCVHCCTSGLSLDIWHLSFFFVFPYDFTIYNITSVLFHAFIPCMLTLVYCCQFIMQHEHGERKLSKVWTVILLRASASSLSIIHEVRKLNSAVSLDAWA